MCTTIPFSIGFTAKYKKPWVGLLIFLQNSGRGIDHWQWVDHQNIQIGISYPIFPRNTARTGFRKKWEKRGGQNKIKCLRVFKELIHRNRYVHSHWFSQPKVQTSRNCVKSIPYITSLALPYQTSIIKKLGVQTWLSNFDIDICMTFYTAPHVWKHRTLPARLQPPRLLECALEQRTKSFTHIIRSWPLAAFIPAIWNIDLIDRMCVEAVHEDE